MAVSKVVYGTSVLVDLTEDTVTAESLLLGCTAHDAKGDLVTGTYAAVPMDPWIEDYNVGYVDNGTWRYEKPTRTYSDIYEVEAGKTYLITLGKNVGSRFRSMFTTSDVTQSTVNVTGTMVVNINNPASFSTAKFEAPNDGYLIIAKDNVGVTGIKTYVYDCEKSWF
jgi:hypothetical protein